MSVHAIIPLLNLLLVATSCGIEPPLHLRKAVEASVSLEMDMEFQAEMIWQVDWETRWEYEWSTEVNGELGYSEPEGIRMHTYTLGPDGQRVSSQTYNFMGLKAEAPVTVGVHDFLFHSNNSSVVLFRSDGELGHVEAYTRVISSGLRASLPVRTVAQKMSVGTKADVSDPENEPVTFQPDELMALYDPGHVISDRPEDYELVDGRYVVRIKGNLHPATMIYLVQVRLLNNDGRVIGSMGGAALTGVAEGTDLETGLNNQVSVSIPFDVFVNKEADPNLLGGRVLTFGIPGCNPLDDASAAAAPEGRHFLVLNITYSNSKYKNVRVDITDQLRALPSGGVIELELDVNDFPPDPDDPDQPAESGGFNPVIGDWEEETGSATIIN